MLGFGYSHNTFEFKPCHFSDRTFADMQRAYVINCSPFAEWIFGTDEPFICCLGHRAVILPFINNSSQSHLVVLKLLLSLVVDWWFQRRVFTSTQAITSFKT